MSSPSIDIFFGAVKSILNTPTLIFDTERSIDLLSKHEFHEKSVLFGRLIGSVSNYSVGIKLEVPKKEMLERVVDILVVVTLLAKIEGITLFSILNRLNSRLKDKCVWACGNLK